MCVCVCVQYNLNPICTYVQNCGNGLRFYLCSFNIAEKIMPQVLSFCQSSPPHQRRVLDYFKYG